MIESLNNYRWKTKVGSIAVQGLYGNVKARNGANLIEGRRDKGWVGLAGILMSLLVLLVSQPVYSQSKKNQQKTAPSSISKSIPSFVYVDPFAHSVKETVDRINRSNRLIELMATPRKNKSTKDLVVEKRLRTKVVFGIPEKKKFSVRYKKDQNNTKPVKTITTTVTKKLSPPKKAVVLTQSVEKTTVNELKSTSPLASRNSKATKNSISLTPAPAEENKDISQVNVTESGFIEFNHFATGFPLTGAHTQVRCDRCHVGGVF